MTYNDESYLASITYGGTTDYYYYAAAGRRYRARLGGTYYRYLYSGDRVLEELNDSGTMQARYTIEDGSYQGMLLHLYRSSGSLSRFPVYDSIGSVRGLADASGTITDLYDLDTFGRQVSSTGSTPNPYRFGGAWGYITDPGGLLQLGARFYWPETGRFVQQDPERHGAAQYDYVDGDPLTRLDPKGASWATVALSYLGGPGFAGACAAAVVSHWAFRPGIANRYKDCMVSCLLTKECGTSTAEVAGLLKEVFDLLASPFSEDFAGSAFQPSDFADNAAGRGERPGCPDSCEDRCSSAGLTPWSPEAPPGPVYHFFHGHR